MTSPLSKKPLEKMEQKLADVLFIEDSKSDIALTQAILKRNNIHFEIHFLRDGEEAMNLFKSEDPFVQSFDLIFMDFNLPKYNGLEVLEFIKNTPTLKHLPVIMFSGSDAPIDMNQAKELGAHSYMVKPLDKNELEKAVTSIPSLEFVTKESDKYLYATN